MSIRMHIRIRMLVVSFLAIASCSLAQEMQQLPNATGIWYTNADEAPKAKWKAHWIWHDDANRTDVLLARKTFTLDKVPERAQLQITASSQYQLFVNGKHLLYGPARSAPHHQSYDILDITGLLQTGTNALAIRVHHQKNKHAYHLKGRAGLLAQLDFSPDFSSPSISTGRDWKVSPDFSWDSNAPLIGRFQQIVNDRVDLGNQFQDWSKANFDDSQWAMATSLMREVGWPSVQKNAEPHALTPPWTNLVAREVPYVEEELVAAVNLVQGSQVGALDKIPSTIDFEMFVDRQIYKGIKKFRTAQQPLEIPAAEKGKAWFLLFDLEKVRNGNPSLEIEGTPGDVVHMVGAPFMVNQKFTYGVVDSEYRDRIMLSGKRDRWEATYFKPTRYLGLIIQNNHAPVALHFFGTRQKKYPFKRKGFIKSAGNPWLENYMEATAKTIDVCTTDAYTDNYRERRQYAQTGYYAALGNYYLFGDTALQRRYLVQVAQEQEANGLMPAYAPLAMDDYMVILDSNCLYIRSLHDYFLYSGDEKTVRGLLPAAKKLMGLLHSYTNEHGMLDNPPYAYWMDHALNDRRGANLNLNGHYLGALEDFARILEWLQEPDENVFRQRANILRTALQDKLWNGEKGLFADAWINGEQSQMFSEHANAAVLALQIAAPNQAKKIAEQLLVEDDHNYIKRESGLIMVTPAMSFYLHKGLCEYGYIGESFKLFRDRFNKMLAPETNGTLWEEWRLDGIGRSGTLQLGRTRSDAQTESAFAPALFAEYIVGVKPLKPGMREIAIAYKDSGILKINADIPTPEGILAVNWDLSKTDAKLLELDIPGNCKVKLDRESLRGVSDKDIYINGIKVPEQSFIELSKGSYTLMF